MPVARNSQQIVETALIKLRYPSKAALTCQPVHEGFSGASLYRLMLPDGEVLLKLTITENNSVPMKRAHREVAFYRDLATQLPVRVPRVLAMCDDEDMTAFLMTSYRSSPTPALWTIEDYLEVARQLGRLHAKFWAKTEQLDYLSWLAWRHYEDAAEDIKHAHLYWQKLREQPRFADVLNHEHYTWLRRLLARIDRVPRMLQVLPLTVCHGDCITHNILRDAGGQFVWADWQEVRLGRGPEDLAFFLQRASAEEATIPREAVIHAYHESLEEHAWRTIPLADIHRVMNASELWVRVLFWPAYLMEASEAALAEMIQQTRMLAERLGIAD